MRVTFWPLVLLLIIASPVFGEENDHHSNPPQFTIVEVPTCCGGRHGNHLGAHHHFDGASNSPEVSASQEAAQETEREIALTAIDAFHDAIQGEHDHNTGLKHFLTSLTKVSTWKKWVNNLNFRQVGVNTYRAYSIKSINPAFREDALNLVFILPFTHFLEMASGPIATTVAAQFGATDAVTYSLGVLGGIISVPGLDPLCILVYSTYPIKAVRQSISAIRRGTTTAVGFAGRVTGLQRLSQRLIQFQDPLQLLERASATQRSTDREFYSVVDGNEYRLLSNDTDRPLLELEFEKLVLPASMPQDRYVVRRLKIYPEALLPHNRRALKRAISGFHWNVREAILQNIEDLEQRRSPRFYVVSRTQSPEWTELIFSPNGVPLPRRATIPWLTSVKARLCNLLLSKP